MYSAFKLFKKKSFNNKEKKILIFVVLNFFFTVFLCEKIKHSSVWKAISKLWFWIQNFCRLLRILVEVLYFYPLFLQCLVHRIHSQKVEFHQLDWSIGHQNW